MRNFIAFISVLISMPIFCKCITPVPDGGGINPSRRSLAGEVVLVRQGFVYILNVDSNSIVKLKINKTIVVYTAFGGGDDIDILKGGLSAKVWLKGCREPKNGNDEVDYFEIFSKDPGDKPDFEYLKR